MGMGYRIDVPLPAQSSYCIETRHGFIGLIVYPRDFTLHYPSAHYGLVRALPDEVAMKIASTISDREDKAGIDFTNGDDARRYLLDGYDASSAILAELAEMQLPVPEFEARPPIPQELIAHALGVEVALPVSRTDAFVVPVGYTGICKDADKPYALVSVADVRDMAAIGRKEELCVAYCDVPQPFLWGHFYGPRQDSGIGRPWIGWSESPWIPRDATYDGIRQAAYNSSFHYMQYAVPTDNRPLIVLDSGHQDRVFSMRQFYLHKYDIRFSFERQFNVSARDLQLEHAHDQASTHAPDAPVDFTSDNFPDVHARALRLLYDVACHFGGALTTHVTSHVAELAGLSSHGYVQTGSEPSEKVTMMRMERPGPLGPDTLLAFKTDLANTRITTVARRPLPPNLSFEDFLAQVVRAEPPQ